MKLARQSESSSQIEEAADIRFRSLADISHSFIWIVHSNSEIVYVNPAWLAFRGRTFEQELGKGWREGLHPDDVEQVLRTYDESFNLRRPFEVVARFRSASREFCWIKNVGAPFLDTCGKFAGFLTSAIPLGECRKNHFALDEHYVQMARSLTRREKEVFLLVASGMSTKEAAAKLGISYKTADCHRSRIMEKLSVHDTVSMVRRGIRAGLVSP